MSNKFNRNTYSACFISPFRILFRKIAFERTPEMIENINCFVRLVTEIYNYFCFKKFF